MAHRSAVVACLLALALALAGCAGGEEPEPADPPADDPPGEDPPADDPPEDDPPADDPPEEDPPEDGPRDPVTWDVSVEDNSFSPGSIVVQVGDTVRWTQTGSNPHSVTADDHSFDSHPDCMVAGLMGCMAEGDTFEHTFEDVGTFGYHCKVHTGMTGSVEVHERYDEVPE